MISALSVTEVVAAFWGQTARGELGATDAAVLDRAFIADLHSDRFTMIAVGESVLTGSLECVRHHRLRAADAVQLASALAARDADTDLATFAAFDQQLRAAAAAEGFALLPT